MPARGPHPGKMSATTDSYIRPKLGGVADDRHAVADRAHHGERAIQQCLAAKLQKCFVFIWIGARAHTGTLASGKDEAHARRYGS